MVGVGFMIKQELRNVIEGSIGINNVMEELIGRYTYLKYSR